MNEYTINVGGLDHTVLLSEEDAKRLGATAVSSKSAPAPANKARQATATKSQS